MLRFIANQVTTWPAARALVVLDTNVVLDWMVFDDPRCRALVRQIESARLQWIATQAMREELARVLTRPALQRWKPDIDAVLACFDRFCQPFAEAPRGGATPRCTDPDDQIFIDLALQAQAQWLFSRDRAVLALASQARRHRVQLLRPEDWKEA